jgi:hypothetical protein
MVFQHRCIPLGVYRGLAFSLDPPPREITIPYAWRVLRPGFSSCPATAEVMTFKTPWTIAKPKSTYRQRMEEDKRQLSLF